MSRMSTNLRVSYTKPTDSNPWVILAIVAFAIGSGNLTQAASPKPDRPTIYGVNPCGDGKAIGATPQGSDFVRYNELVWQKIAEAGGRSARILACWREIEPTKSNWNWSDLDEQVTTCDKYDIEPVVLIYAVPGWASPTSKPAHDLAPRPETLPDFDNFLIRLAQRYKGRVKCYEFWNEQNAWGWHVDKGPSGEPKFNRVDEYLPLLYHAYKNLKSVDADIQVAMGGMDDVAGNAWIFVEMAYKMRKEQFKNEKFWDAIADHAYNAQPSDVITPLCSKLDNIRQVAARFGDKDIPLWITEYGWNAGKENTSPALQAWGVWGFLEFFARRDQRDVRIAQYVSISDFEPVHQGYGLCNLNLKPSPAFYEFQKLTRADVPQLRDLDYRLPGGDAIRVTGEFAVWPPVDDLKAFLQVIDEQGKIRAHADIKSREFDLSMPNLPADEPLLAELRFIGKGDKPQHPIARLPLLRPAKGILANGKFDAIFRAGIPWGWISIGEAILRDTKALGKDYQHGGNSVALIIFDNCHEYCFADRLQSPVVATKGQHFKASCWAKLFSSETAEAAVRIRLALVDPDVPRTNSPTGSPVRREWAAIEADLVAPCDAPLLDIDIQSDRLPATGKHQQWTLAIDDVSLTPLPATTK